VVTVSARLEPAAAAAGETVSLIVTATVDSKYHLYGMKQPPGEGPGPVATEITLAEASASLLDAAGDWKEPTAKLKHDEGFQREVSLLYGSPLEFRRDYTIKAGTAPGEIAIKGSVYAQACTETSCLPPKEIAFETTLSVVAGAPKSTPAPAPTSGAAAVVEPTPEKPSIQKASGGTEEAIAEKDFAGFLLYAFLFGLAALATPCVFPMIPITISFFTNKSGKNTAQAAKMALIYVVSIIAGFALIGFGISMLLLVAGSGISSAGFANWVAANPWVNLAFATLYLVFALALFEVLHLKMPDAIASRLNKGALGRSDALGIAMKALVFVVISFTCTAPLIGVLIVQTLKGGEWIRPLFGMIAFATGFASPFFFLALVPQVVSALPKAGSWMFSTKVVMGLVVIAAAFKFLSNADLVWNKGDMLLTREALLAVWVTLSAVIAFYLLRFFRMPEDDDTRSVGFPRLAFGIGFFSLALYMASGLFGGKLHGWFEAYLPPDLSNKGDAMTLASGGAGSSNARTETGGTEISAGFSWFEELEPAIAQARKLERNIFIDFTGYTCTNCRLMEKNMFPRPEIAPLLGEYVRVKLVTDDRQTGAKWQEYQAATFGTVALPFYAIITPDGEILGKAEYTTDVAAYAAFLKRGLKAEVASAK
jgi:thiol:disulfide interchange protein